MKKLSRGTDWELVDGRPVRLSEPRALPATGVSFWDYTSAVGEVTSERLELWTLHAPDVVLPPGFAPMSIEELTAGPGKGEEDASRCLRVSGPAGCGVSTYTRDMETGRTYEVRAGLLAETGPIAIRATGLPDGEWSEQVTGDGWRQVTYRFVSDGATVKVYLVLAADGAFRLDNVAVQEIPQRFID